MHIRSMRAIADAGSGGFCEVVSLPGAGLPKLGAMFVEGLRDSSRLVGHSPAEAVRDPEVVARGETVRLQHPGAPDADVYGPGLPIVFSGSAAGSDQPPPGIGEHNGEVYGDLLGHTQSDLRELQSNGVI